MKVYITNDELNGILDALDKECLPPCGKDGWRPSEKDADELIHMAEECEKDWKNPSQRQEFLKYITMMCWISDAGKNLEPGVQKKIRAFINDRTREED